VGEANGKSSVLMPFRRKISKKGGGSFTQEKRGKEQFEAFVQEGENSKTSYPINKRGIAKRVLTESLIDEWRQEPRRKKQGGKALIKKGVLGTREKERNRIQRSTPGRTWEKIDPIFRT